MYTNFDEQNPAKIYRTLLENVQLIEAKSKEVIAKRNDVILLEARLMDKKEQAFLDRDNEGVTRAKELAKIDCLAEEKAFKKGEAELRNLMDEMTVLQEINMSYKLAIKFKETEIKNLHYES